MTDPANPHHATDRAPADIAALIDELDHNPAALTVLAGQLDAMIAAIDSESDPDQPTEDVANPGG